MAERKKRLELTWIGKEERPRLEPRILLEDADHSYHAAKRVTDNDVFDNRLIHGDNLLALKALEQEFAGKVKCVFIDPPYNTGSAFEQYDDGLEHSIWLSLMRDRLEVIHKLLAEDGSLWITIDDNEAHYLKVMCDEIFGRFNFVANAVWQKKYTVANDSKWLSESHDHVLIYARNKENWRPYRLPRTEEMDARYRNPDNHPKGPWKATPIYAKRSGSEKEQAFSFTFKNGVVWSAPRGTSPRFPAQKLRQLDANNEIWFGADGTATPARKTFLNELKIEGPPAPTVWLHSDVGNNHEAREEAKASNPDAPFATPKPERLLKRILELATQPGDLVLDSFAGSGTTGAVAHKLGRRWIMVELGPHCETHIAPRLRRIVEGTDALGITEAVGWEGGGGFRFFNLAPSLEPRILLQDTELSYRASSRVTDHDLFDNRLIHGDNLLALKALEQEFAGKIKCIYIDPPFNTGQAFEHYDDGLEHSLWLSLIRDRLQVLHSLLADDGTLFVHIDDNEIAYLIVLLDEIFGRTNRVSVVTFKQGAPTGHKAINPGCVTTTNFVLLYAKDHSRWTPNRLFVARERDVRYSQFVRNRDKHISKWEIIPLLEGFAEEVGLDTKEARARVKTEPELLDAFVLEHADAVAQLVRPDYKAVSEAARQMIDRSKADPENVFHLPREEHSDFYFIRGQRILFYANKIKTIDGEQVSGEPLTTLWDDLLSNNLHKEGGVAFPKSKKPEALLKRVIELSTRKGDWVLDSFAGSGTTGAVAHKMGRRWVMVELGEHCHSHVLPRLKSVIDGSDSSGVTSDVKWKGGGGFRFFNLAPAAEVPGPPLPQKPSPNMKTGGQRCQRHS